MADVKTTVTDIMKWLSGLVKDNYPEDRLYEGSPDGEVKGILMCWWANAGARKAAMDRNANLIIAHETPYFETPRIDPGCPPPEKWKANLVVKRFYAENKIAFIRSHRTLDAFCIGEVFGRYLGFPTPIIRDGYTGYQFTLVYDLRPVVFEGLVSQLKDAMKIPLVRTSVCHPRRLIHRVGLGWGGVGLSSNLQYLECLRKHNVQVVIGGEFDEYAMEYCRESGMDWIELGHYASEIIGIEYITKILAAQFLRLPISCYQDKEKIMFQ